MSDFWPEGISLDDVASPLEILEEAARSWFEKTGGQVELVIQSTTSKSSYTMFIVHGKHVPSNRTVSLFSVVHRPDAPYPARIQMDDDSLPEFFKKVYYQPGPFAAARAMSSILSERAEGQQIVDKWVCDVPSEFRSKLRDAFNDGAVKTKILNLISAPKQVEQPKPDAKPEEGV